MANHPHRLPESKYVGKHTHFVTVSTHFRREIFRDPAACRLVIEQLLRASRKLAFSVIAYTVIPDHVHVLITGTRDDCDFRKWINLFKQLTAYYEKKRSGWKLWQEGYWDRTLRDDEPTLAIASYIVWNPVEAKLVERPADYPYSGSETSSIDQLAGVPPQAPDIAAEGDGFSRRRDLTDDPIEVSGDG